MFFLFLFLRVASLPCNSSVVPFALFRQLDSRRPSLYLKIGLHWLLLLSLLAMNRLLLAVMVRVLTLLLVLFLISVEVPRRPLIARPKLGPPD